MNPDWWLMMFASHFQGTSFSRIFPSLSFYYIILSLTPSLSQAGWLGSQTGHYPIFCVLLKMMG
jgi:hypothetical protein